ncbi:MAG: L,D-transpeptidase family protein [Armatimonadetes bacterium]|nr:L,D-transpeptidase family protein [Armatimonadota bacterium]
MRRLVLPLMLLGIVLAAPAFARKELLVDLSKSTVYAMENGKVVRALVINPGATDSPTRPGRYRISQKVRSGYRSNLVDIHNKPLRKGGLGAPMDYWMRLGGTGMGFHRSSLWRPNGRWGSHGCLRMSRAGARWLHDWTPMGAPVTVVSGGSKYVSAVKSKRKGTLAKASGTSSKRVKTAKARKPASTVAVAKKKTLPVAKPKPTVAVSRPKTPVEPVTTVTVIPEPGPAPEVAPIDTTREEPVSEPSNP